MVNLDLQEQLQNALANIRLPHDSPEHEVVTEQKLVNRLKLVLSACFHNSNIARKSRKVHCEPFRLWPIYQAADRKDLILSPFPALTMATAKASMRT